jgi:PhzF family phenazine biosynthesis protein
MELEFLTLDVFTATPYEGNPLAIVKVPASLKSSLAQTTKQKIARNFNLSETVFLHENEKDKHEWVVDIFTTQEELPFAGHPTIGSACYVLNMSDFGVSEGTLITKAGPMRISKASSGGVAASISHNVRIHKQTINDVGEVSGKSRSLPEIAEAEKHAPLVSIVKGMTFLLIKLPSLNLLGQVQITNQEINSSELLDSDWGQDFVAKYYYVIDENSGGEHGGGVTRIRTRMIEVAMEDPATGSAACALASFLALTGVGVQGKVGRYEMIQGVEMGRRSVIGVDVEVEGGGQKVQSVRLSGEAVQVMEGKLRI